MKIPKIIHQTWKTSRIPKSFETLSDSWKSAHLDWDYVLWTDELNRNFILNYFPDFITTYDKYPRNILRVDAVRYLILLIYGGVFVDFDYECLKNVEPLLSDAEIVFGEEPLEHATIHNKKRIISNAFMASVPDHPFFHVIKKELFENHNLNKYTSDSDSQILETTGPFMLTRIVEEHRRDTSIKILSDSLLYPITKSELNDPYIMNDDIIQQKICGAYAIHYYHGTWWSDRAISELVSVVKPKGI